MEDPSTLQEALRRRDISFLVSALNQGADPNSIFIKGITDILLLSLQESHKTLFDLCLNVGFDCSKHRFSYLTYASEIKDSYFLKKILEEYKKHNIDLNEINLLGNNALAARIYKGFLNAEDLLALSEAGVDWLKANNENTTPFEMFINDYDETIPKILWPTIKTQHERLWSLSPIYDFEQDQSWSYKNKDLLAFLE